MRPPLAFRTDHPTHSLNLSFPFPSFVSRCLRRARFHLRRSKGTVGTFAGEERLVLTAVCVVADRYSVFCFPFTPRCPERHIDLCRQFDIRQISTFLTWLVLFFFFFLFSVLFSSRLACAASKTWVASAIAVAMSRSSPSRNGISLWVAQGNGGKRKTEPDADSILLRASMTSSLPLSSRR